MIVHYAKQAVWIDGAFILPDQYVDTIPAPTQEEYPDIPWLTLAECTGLNSELDALEYVTRNVEPLVHDLKGKYVKEDQTLGPTKRGRRKKYKTEEEALVARRAQDKARKAKWAKDNPGYSKQYYWDHKDHLNAENKARNKRARINAKLAKTIRKEQRAVSTGSTSNSI
jgi:hypothetical protein